MTKEELVQFLKDNLEIEVKVEGRTYEPNWVEISLKLGDEIISQSSERIS